MGSFAPPPTTALAPGDRLDRYELLCVLAQGGMGTVWLARLTGKHGFERLIALKTILPTYGHDRQFSDMFLDEARIAAQVDHENVARILEIGEDRGVLYHAMELVDGESLRKLYRDVRAVGAPFPLGVALRIAADVCAGLHAVHELRGGDGALLEVVHRDVSPQNILLSLRGTVKLIDFGVAKARERRTEETTAGTLKGKIEYMAPEQAMGAHVDRRADVYAVGAVLYELLTGEPLRNTEDGRQLVALHELITGAPFKPLPQSIPLPVRAVVERALCRDPDLRQPTTDDMRRALEQAMVTIGQLATTDDAANVLAHYSRERTQKRKDAIDLAIRAADARRSTAPTMVVPVTPLAPASGAFRAPPSSQSRMAALDSTAAFGRGATRVMAPIAVSDGTGSASGTGPSMATMQGAAMPPSRSGGASRIFGGAVVLALVGVLGVTIGVVATRSAAPPPPAPSVAVAARAEPASTESVGAASASASASAPAPASASAVPSASARPRRVPVPASKKKTESTDDYGF
jgi:eukaryotic-like serine/threonine-protein kinase